jgi:ABC-type Fe3+-hydroxamate transport system substrate-binding protein
MPDLEKRVQALEQTAELHTIALHAMVDKTTLEKLGEKYDKLFDALITHDRITNVQLAELREKDIELDGKIVGLQTEMRQRFAEQDSKIAALQTEMRQRFAEQDGKIVGLQTEMRQRFAEQDSKIAALDNRMAALDSGVAALDGKVASLQEVQTEHTTLLQQILARLPEKPLP